MCSSKSYTACLSCEHFVLCFFVKFYEYLHNFKWSVPLLSKTDCHEAGFNARFVLTDKFDGCWTKKWKTSFMNKLLT